MKKPTRGGAAWYKEMDYRLCDLSCDISFMRLEVNISMRRWFRQFGGIITKHNNSLLIQLKEQIK